MFISLAFGIGTQELIVIAVIVVVLFGATKIPKLGASIGEGIRNFKRGMRQVEIEEEEAKKDKERKALENQEIAVENKENAAESSRKV